MTNSNINNDNGGNSNGINAVRDRLKEMLRQRRYQEAERVERDEGLPYTMLNCAISEIIMERNGQSRELIEIFAHRGYGAGWMKDYGSEEKKPIKSGEAR